MLCAALYSGDKSTGAALMASVSVDSLASNCSSGWGGKAGEIRMDTIIHGVWTPWHPSGQGVEWGWLWGRACAGPCVPLGTGCHCPLHSCGTCPPLCPCCSCRLGSEKRTHPAHVRATGCCCHEHCEVGNYCAGFSSCPTAGQTLLCHESGLASANKCLLLC